MRSKLNLIVLILIPLVGVLQACAPQRSTAPPNDFAWESSLRTQIVAEITMTAAQDAIAAAQSTADSALQTLAAPTSTPPVPTTTLPTSQPAKWAAIVVASKITVREGPDVKFPPVADCYSGAAVFLISKYGEWVYIELEDGLKGWAYYGWLQFPSGVRLSDLPDATTVPVLHFPWMYP